MKRLRLIALLPVFAALGACNAIVLRPYGDVAAQQRDLLVYSTVLMLFVIVPVMALTVLFVWRYRASNRTARYEPDWDHSTQLELLIWSIPLLVIICLGALTWVGTHLLDPYRPLDRIGPSRSLAGAATPLRVDVVALDWKWLFIYPEYGIATVNELAAPVDRPIDFHITASSVMNSFYIPALAGQIYAMPAMETRLHAVINQAGDYEGFSANYSGAGFSGMHFVFHGLSPSAFDQWVAAIRTAGDTLTRTGYIQLERPSENVPVHRYATVDAGLYDAILNLCVEPGKPCMTGMAPMHMARNGAADLSGAGSRSAVGMPMSGGHSGGAMSMNMPGMDMSARSGAAAGTQPARSDAHVPGAGLAPPAFTLSHPSLTSRNAPASGSSAY